MKGEARVPPDSGVDVLWNLLSCLIRSRFAGSPVGMHEFGMRDHHLRRLALAGMHIEFVGSSRTSVLRCAFVKYVDDIVMRLIKLRLCEKRQQAVIASVAVDDQDLLTSIARHLICRFLEEGELQSAAESHGAGLMFGLCDLSEVILREHDRIFLLSSVKCGVANIQQICSERQVWTMFLDNPKGKQAYALGTMNPFAEVGSSEFLPMNREFR